ncbi:disulfide bond formation protein B [Roseibium algae]|uniref:Disulfide bond formation protein B n=1 Tax=Roseibium algae TaxID=3123038 RepID=A0ABU8TGV3_9HYPH
MISQRNELLLNAFGLLGISVTLAVAFLFQILGGELPCPLCLLQRAGFLLLAVGPVLNICKGPKSAHYGITILAAIVGAGFAVRQVLLHIVPGDGGYGSTVMGLHMYTWSLIIFLGGIVACAVMLLFRSPENDAAVETKATVLRVSVIGSIAVASVIGLAGLNFASTVVECGFATCPDNPVSYILLK